MNVAMSPVGTIKRWTAIMNALRGNRTPGGSNTRLPAHGNDPGYHYPINALDVNLKSLTNMYLIYNPLTSGRLCSIFSGAIMNLCRAIRSAQHAKKQNGIY